MIDGKIAYIRDSKRGLAKSVTTGKKENMMIYKLNLDLPWGSRWIAGSSLRKHYELSTQSYSDLISMI